MNAFLAGTACLVLATRTATARAAQDQDLVARGGYLATAGDCAACHTAEHGAPYAGGLSIKTPIGTIFSTNITPDPDNGIGRWSEADFALLMRHGISKNGTAVYPAMPYPSYSRLSSADMHALYAFFMHGVAPAATPDRPSRIPWPLSIRWPLRLWSAAFAPKPVEAASADKDALASVARGAYLVEGLGHCGACHTPRRLTMNEEALTGADGDAYLAGGAPVDGWDVPSLRGDDVGGLGRWSKSEIVAFLKTGRNHHAASFGGMTTVVTESMQHLTDTDLESIALYLKSLAPPQPATGRYVYDASVSRALYRGDVSSPGAQIYVDRCAACHRTDGAGYDGIFPALAGNPVLQAGDGMSAIHVVLAGARLPGMQAAPSTFVMGPYRDVLSDSDVAAVVSFIRTSWGNQGGAVTAGTLAKVRAASISDSNGLIPTFSPAVKHDRP